VDVSLSYFYVFAHACVLIWQKERPHRDLSSARRQVPARASANTYRRIDVNAETNRGELRSLEIWSQLIQQTEAKMLFEHYKVGRAMQMLDAVVRDAQEQAAGSREARSDAWR
jgi:hypothetical protein